MRVIAGSAGGIRLDVPKQRVRPTMDRVKAAIFSSLGDRVIGARVLDLFAGSGALGIEALSRGAQSALFVDDDRAAISAIEANLKKAGVTGRIVPNDVFHFLKRSLDLTALSSQVSRPTEPRFDIIFADPPYEQTRSGERFTEKLLSDDALPRLLAPGGVFVLEKRPGEDLPASSHWNVLRQKRYGATEVLFLSEIPARSASLGDAGGRNPKSEIE
jgi:16S rRNA (guanine966-N2)-methyltransferase